MIGRVLAVAANTRQEAFRNRAFVVIVILGVGLILAGWALSNLAVSSQKVRVIQNFGYFAVSAIAAISAILMGIILLYKELDRKTIYTLVPKPVMRHEIVLGKFVGLVTLIAGLIVFLGLCWLASLLGHDALEVGGEPILGDVLFSLVLMWFEACLIVAVALVFSSWTRPFLSGMFTVGYWLLGRTVFVLQEHLEANKGALSEPGPLRSFVKVVVWIMPDLQIFNLSRELALGIHVHGGYVLSAAGYAASFIAVLLAIAVLLFSRRDFV